MKQTYIVTGANGFLGNTIVRKLAESEDNEIRALVLPGDSTKALDGVRCTLFYGDVTQPDTLQPLFDVEDGTPLYVIHCAALVSIKSRHNPSIRAVNVTARAMSSSRRFAIMRGWYTSAVCMPSRKSPVNS